MCFSSPLHKHLLLTSSVSGVNFPSQQCGGWGGKRKPASEISALHGKPSGGLDRQAESTMTKVHKCHVGYLWTWDNKYKETEQEMRAISVCGHLPPVWQSYLQCLLKDGSSQKLATERGWAFGGFGASSQRLAVGLASTLVSRTGLAPPPSFGPSTINLRSLSFSLCSLPFCSHLLKTDLSQVYDPVVVWEDHLDKPIFVPLLSLMDGWEIKAPENLYSYHPILRKFYPI